MDGVQVTLDGTTLDFSLSDVTVHGGLYLDNEFSDKKITISSSIVLGAVNLVGGATSGLLEIKGSTLKSGNIFLKRGNYTIYNNILLDAIQVSPSDISDWGDPGPNPNIEGIVFSENLLFTGGLLGLIGRSPFIIKFPWAVTISDIPQSYTPAWDNNAISIEPAFLHYKGSYVDDTITLVACVETMPYPPSQVFPKIWGGPVDRRSKRSRS